MATMFLVWSSDRSDPLSYITSDTQPWPSVLRLPQLIHLMGLESWRQEGQLLPVGSGQHGEAQAFGVG